MAVSHILDNLLGQHSKVAVLRLLLQEKELVGREVSRKAGLSPRAGHLALKDLLKQGVLIRKIVGPSHVFSLNEKRYAVKKMLAPLFERERQLLPTLAGEIRRLIPKKDIICLTIFGSLARGESSHKSDVDLLVLLKKSSGAAKARRLIERHSEDFVDHFGMFLSPYVIGLREFARRFDARDRLIRSMVREGWVVWGKPLGEVLAYGTKKNRH